MTVSLADQTLTGPVQPVGLWSVTASALADGPHRVVMTVSDAAGNVATLTQTLTVDTVSPLVTITGGPNTTTNDVDPTITGTSDAAPGTTVTVSIAGQTMTTLLQGNGTWNVTPAFVGEGTWVGARLGPRPGRQHRSAAQTLTIAGEAVTLPPALSPTATTVPPGTPGAGPVDNAAAMTTIARDSRQRIKRSRLSIATKVTAPAGGRVVATMTGAVKIRGVAKAIKLTAAKATIAAGRSVTMRLTPAGSKRAVKAALKRLTSATRQGKTVTAMITVTIVDADADQRTLTRSVRLTK